MVQNPWLRGLSQETIGLTPDGILHIAYDRRRAT